MSDEIKDDEIAFHVWPPEHSLADRGGQHVGRASVGVLVRHKPTGIAVICDSERSMLGCRQKAVAKIAELLSVDIVDRVARDSVDGERRALLGFLLDRAEQYDNSSGYRALFDELVEGVAEGRHADCAQAGEYDGLARRIDTILARRPTP